VGFVPNSAQMAIGEPFLFKNSPLLGEKGCGCRGLPTAHPGVPVPAPLLPRESSCSGLCRDCVCSRTGNASSAPRYVLCLAQLGCELSRPVLKKQQNNNNWVITALSGSSQLASAAGAALSGPAPLLRTRSPCLCCSACGRSGEGAAAQLRLWG